MDATERMSRELERARIHLSRLEKDATHPLDFTVQESHTAPSLILRAGEHLRSAHSDVSLDYELMRRLLIEALRARIAELEEKLVGSAPALSLDELQYGDQTEA
ncbi:hypothetical protein [Ancylobacter sp. G4_0304]|uniref:hypothetical protein n=1 Tax=Ancylobacter sp. G4_0304 TaxID=3114289 RepID=UPI0039C5C903